jgi:hypothetical protein
LGAGGPLQALRDLSCAFQRAPSSVLPAVVPSVLPSTSLRTSAIGCWEAGEPSEDFLAQSQAAREASLGLREVVRVGVC